MEGYQVQWSIIVTNTKDVLLDKPLPSTSGVSTVTTNIGENTK